MKSGFDVNTRYGEGKTPLIIFAQEGDAKIVEVLLSMGANVNAQSNRGSTALQLTQEVGYCQFHYAAINDHSEIVEMLLSAGADTEIKNRRGVTALDNVERGDHSEITKLIMNRAKNAYDSAAK